MDQYLRLNSQRSLESVKTPNIGGSRWLPVRRLLFIHLIGTGVLTWDVRAFLFDRHDDRFWFCDLGLCAASAVLDVSLMSPPPSPSPTPLACFLTNRVILDSVTITFVPYGVYL